ncbi:hypothetical protein PYW08_012265 [Mythimna loreyi]|uniref:Uncharacterized protein n=1 Tax=Mythimna loreyi TaxID=667449 RepID=A0ACC2Q1L0_9NEOP|nr:hypothetical protein PYW08_012265 [Mythimna loreyi]
MPACCIATCGARKNKNQPKLTLHRFPKKEPLRKKWLEAIGKVNINTKYREWYVCSLHFNESCFNRTLEVIRLRDDSVPTEFLKRHQDLSDLSESDTIGKGDDDSDDTTTELDPLQISDEETVQKEVEDNEKVKELESKCVKQPKKIKRLNEMIQKRNKKGRKEPAVAIEVLAEPRDSKKRFPQHEKLCRKWLDIIGLDNIKPEQKKPQVCSSHFTRSSFKKTLGVTKLRDDALPSKHLVPSKESHGSVSRIIKKALKRASSKKLQLRSKKKRLDQDCNETDTESISSEEEMPSMSESLMVCRVCLALDVKMFDMKDLKLTETFQNITGLSVSDEKDYTLHRLCWECTSRLTTASTFRNKALLSDALLKNIASMNKSDIANLRHIYRDSLQSSLTTQSVLHEFDNEEMESNSEEMECVNSEEMECVNSEEMECVNSEEMECVNSETDFEDDEPLVNLQKDAESDQGGNKNKYIKNKDTEENIEVYNSSNVISVNEVLSKAPINEDCYLVIVTGDEDSKRKVDVVGNTGDKSLSKVITQSLVEASGNKAKKVTFKDVGALSEEGNRLNDSEKLKSIASKRKSHSVAERSEETKNSLIVQNIVTVNRLNNQLTLAISSKNLKPNKSITIENKTPSTCKDAVKDENKKRLKNENGLNGPGFDDPGFDSDGIADTDVTDKSDSSEDDLLSDKENYSSDDGLPLEKCKERPKSARIKKIKDQSGPKYRRKERVRQNDDMIRSVFTITDLTYEEQMAEIMKRKETPQYINSYFKCTLCFKGFLDEEGYNIHMFRHTNQFGDYECQICKMHFQYRRILNTHMTKHTQRYSCKECTFVTTHRQTATAHARWHKGTKYQCPHCPQQFEHHTTYMGHIRIKHASDFACEICGYSFVSAKGLQQHKNLKHRLVKEEIPEDGPYCEPCNVRFISSEAYTRHIRVSAKHNTDKNSREPNTPKKKVYKSTDKVRTKRVRSSPTSKKDKKKEGLIPCEQCSVQLKGTQAYNIHFRRMHPDKNRTKYPTMRQPSMCELCGRMVSSFQLKYHCCPQNQERPFSCESCGKTFKARSSLHMHQRLHSKERTTYPCSICGKHFSNITNRCRHMFIHTGLKPHKCEICDKNFRTVTEKRAHINYVHLKKPWPKRNRDKRKTDTR